MVKNNTLAEIWNKEFDRVAPIGFTYERDTPRSKEISSKVRKFYLGDKKIDYETVDKFGEVSRSRKISEIHSNVHSNIAGEFEK